VNKNAQVGKNAKVKVREEEGEEESARQEDTESTPFWGRMGSVL